MAMAMLATTPLWKEASAVLTRLLPVKKKRNNQKPKGTWVVLSFGLLGCCLLTDH
jgi:hypothetical protein